jgi:hypothetical protein
MQIRCVSMRWLLALALVLEGHGRAEAVKSCGMDRLTLRDWVVRHNEQGIAGLSNHPHGGGAAPKRPPRSRCNLRAGSAKGRISLKMVSCVGGYAICGTGSWRVTTTDG